MISLFYFFSIITVPYFDNTFVLPISVERESFNQFLLNPPAHPNRLTKNNKIALPTKDVPPQL